MKKRFYHTYTVLLVVLFVIVSCESENEYLRVEGSWKIAGISFMGINQNMEQFVRMMESFGVDATCMESTTIELQADGNGLLIFPCKSTSPQTMFVYTVQDNKISVNMNVDGELAMLSGIVSSDYNYITIDDFGLLVNYFVGGLPDDIASVITESSVSISLVR